MHQIAFLCQRTVLSTGERHTRVRSRDFPIPSSTTSSGILLPQSKGSGQHGVISTVLVIQRACQLTVPWRPMPARLDMPCKKRRVTPPSAPHQKVLCWVYSSRVHIKHHKLILRAILGHICGRNEKTGSGLSRGDRVPSVRDRHGSSPLPVRAPAPAAAGGHDASVRHTRRASRHGNSCRKPSVDPADGRGTFWAENEEAREALPPRPPPLLSGSSTVGPHAVISCQHAKSVGACSRYDTFSTTRMVHYIVIPLEVHNPIDFVPVCRCLPVCPRLV